MLKKFVCALYLYLLSIIIVEYILLLTVLILKRYDLC